MKLKDKLDIIFSKFIRLRDADSSGIIKCISCDKPFRWKEADNGHYVSRSHMSTRFDEENCNAQCTHCNRELGGNLVKYKIGIIKKYGIEVIADLQRLQNQMFKYLDSDYKTLIKVYSQKVKELQKEKCL